MGNFISSGIRRVFDAMWNALGGKIVTMAFLQRHFTKIALLMFVIFGLISNKFGALIEMKNIKSLEMRLTDVKSDYMITSEEYFGKAHRASMQNVIDSLGLELNSAIEPHYKLSCDE